MSGDPATPARRTLVALARKIPFLDRLRRARDDLRAENSRLLSERDGLAAALRHAEAERWRAERAREQAEEARWQAVRDREQAEEARWQAVRARERAERARFQALQGEGREMAPPGFAETHQETWAAQQDGADGEKEKMALAAIANVTDKARTARSGARATNAGLMKISVVLPNYNHGAFIRDNISAVLAQTYPNWEMVIVDDGSTDDSAATIRAFAQSDPRIVPIFLPQNRGVIFAFKTGLAAITGELLYGSAADDYIANDRFFERVIAALAEFPRASGVFGKAKVIHPKSGETLWEMGLAPARGLVEQRRALEGFLTGSLFVPGAAAIWKRADIDALGGFDEDLGPQCDYFLNHALPAVSGAVFIDEVFTAVRTDTGNYHQTGGADEFFRRHALVERKLRSHLAAPPDPNWLQIWRERIVESRLATTRQRRFFDSVRATLDGIEPWERTSLPPGFIDCSTRLLAEVEQLEYNLDQQIASAHSTLDTIAGLLPPENSPNSAAPS